VSGIRERAGRAVQLYPVTAGALVAFTVAAIALGLVLDEQSNGRARDAQAAEARVRLKHTDQRLGAAIDQIQESRREGIRISCKTNQGQNNVLLALIQFSIRNAQRDGRQINPDDLARTRRLLRPITPERTQQVCDALLTKVENGPPPP